MNRINKRKGGRQKIRIHKEHIPDPPPPPPHRHVKKLRKKSKSRNQSKRNDLIWTIFEYKDMTVGDITNPNFQKKIPNSFSYERVT